MVLGTCRQAVALPDSVLLQRIAQRMQGLGECMCTCAQDGDLPAALSCCRVSAQAAGAGGGSGAYGASGSAAGGSGYGDDAYASGSGAGGSQVGPGSSLSHPAPRGLQWASMMPTPRGGRLAGGLRLSGQRLWQVWWQSRQWQGCMFRCVWGSSQSGWVTWRQHMGRPCCPAVLELCPQRHSCAAAALGARP